MLSEPGGWIKINGFGSPDPIYLLKSYLINRYALISKTLELDSHTHSLTTCSSSSSFDLVRIHNTQESQCRCRRVRRCCNTSTTVCVWPFRTVASWLENSWPSIVTWTSSSETARSSGSFHPPRERNLLTPTARTVVPSASSSSAARRSSPWLLRVPLHRRSHAPRPSTPPHSPDLASAVPPAGVFPLLLLFRLSPVSLVRFAASVVRLPAWCSRRSRARRSSRRLLFRTHQMLRGCGRPVRCRVIQVHRLCLGVLLRLCHRGNLPRDLVVLRRNSGSRRSLGRDLWGHHRLDRWWEDLLLLLDPECRPHHRHVPGCRLLLAAVFPFMAHLVACPLHQTLKINNSSSNGRIDWYVFVSVVFAHSFPLVAVMLRLSMFYMPVLCSFISFFFLCLWWVIVASIEGLNKLGVSWN